MRGSGWGRGMLSNLVASATLLASVQVLAEAYVVREYDSPMTVETGFVLADHSLWGARQWRSAPEYDRVSASICNHVKITRLELNVEEMPKAKGDVVKLGVRGKIKNEFGGDKIATLRFEVMNGEEVAATVNVEVGIEDDEERGFKGFASVPASVLPSDPAARMRITMNVEMD
jgi:hypothetical protein